MPRPFALSRLVLIACLASAAHAGEIYKWVDDNGHTHISDIVPERYRASARRYDSAAFEATECYSRFRVSNLGIRGEEAVRSCGPPIADPAARCGAVRKP